MAIDKKKVKLYKSTDSLTAKYDIVLNCYATNDKDTLLHLNKDLRHRLAEANSNRSKDIEDTICIRCIRRHSCLRRIIHSRTICSTSR